jgi:hypothetical protein
MKGLLILLFFCCFATTTAFAQMGDYGDVRSFEGEVGFGVTAGGRARGVSVTPGLSLFAEVRYNIPKSPFDVGLQGYLGSFDRDNVVIAGNSFDMHIMPRLLTVYGDYNFRKWKRVSLFGGVGAGYAYVINQRNATGHSFGKTLRERFFAFSPRIGAEFFNHIRLTLDYKLISKDYSCFGANLSFVFGGGMQK